MKAHITDATLIRTLGPAQLATYLRVKGWEETYREKDRLSVWELPANGGSGVTLPLNPRFDDYARRVYEVLQSLEKAEERSQLEIFVDISHSRADVVRIRAIGDEDADGTLPIESGVRLVESGRDLMLSAACSAVVRKRVFPTRKPDDAVALMERLRMGQTETGSYVMTIICPVRPDLAAQPELFEESPRTDDPFERKVTMNLMAAVAATKEAAEESTAKGQIEPFSLAVMSGVSANLCEALIALQEGTESRAIEVGCSWSPARPIRDQRIPSEVQISRDLMPAVEEASRYFREFTPQEDYHLVGFVTRLHREATATGGEVTISEIFYGRPRKIKVFFGGEDYMKAVESHRDKLVVSCVGELAKVGSGFTLRFPHTLETLTSPEED